MGKFAARGAKKMQLCSLSDLIFLVTMISRYQKPGPAGQIKHFREIILKNACQGGTRPNHALTRKLMGSLP